MNKQIAKKLKQLKRHNKVRSTIQGTAARPRLSVFRSNKSLYVQLINDDEGVTLAGANTKELKTKGTKTEIALELGKLIAEKAKAKKITTVVFDRAGYRYHGRVKAVAEGAREGGLVF